MCKDTKLNAHPALITINQMILFDKQKTNIFVYIPLFLYKYLYLYIYINIYIYI